MKKMFLTVLLLAILSVSMFGLEQAEIDKIVAAFEIGNTLRFIDGLTPWPQGAIRTSPDTYLIRGSGLGGDERLSIITRNNVLGVVAVAFTDTGPNSRRAFNSVSSVLDSEIFQREFRFENRVVSPNSIQGTIVRRENGRRYNFSLQYSPQIQQRVMTFTRG